MELTKIWYLVCACLLACLSTPSIYLYLITYTYLPSYFSPHNIPVKEWFLCLFCSWENSSFLEIYVYITCPGCKGIKWEIWSLNLGVEQLGMWGQPDLGLNPNSATISPVTPDIILFDPQVSTYMKETGFNVFKTQFSNTKVLEFHLTLKP